MSSFRFLRPMWMVHLHLLATILFGGLTAIYLFSGKYFLSFAWLVICSVWWRRWHWVQKNPNFEITKDEIIAHFGPSRQRAFPLSDLESFERGSDEATADKLYLRLRDSSVIALPGERLMDGRRVEEVLAFLGKRLGASAGN